MALKQTPVAAPGIIPAPVAQLPWRIIFLVLGIGCFGLLVLYSAAPAESGGGGASAVEAADGEDHGRAALGQDLGGLETDPAAGAGDDEASAVLAGYVAPVLSRQECPRRS